MPPSAIRQNFSDDAAGRTTSLHVQRVEHGLAYAVVAVRTAGSDPQRPPAGVRVRIAHVARIAIATKAPRPARAMPEGAGDRLRITPKVAHAIFDQRDVDGELAVALDELAGAVERIDQPERDHARRAAMSRSVDSSDSTGICGVSACRPATMQRCEAMSAAVSGERSSLCSTANSLS